jgi:hypothetical protein
MIEGFTVWADCQPFAITKDPIRQRFRLLMLLVGLGAARVGGLEAGDWGSWGSGGRTLGLGRRGLRGLERVSMRGGASQDVAAVHFA